MLEFYREGSRDCCSGFGLVLEQLDGQGYHSLRANIQIQTRGDLWEKGTSSVLVLLGLVPGECAPPGSSLI